MHPVEQAEHGLLPPTQVGRMYIQSPSLTSPGIFGKFNL